MSNVYNVFQADKLSKQFERDEIAVPVGVGYISSQDFIAPEIKETASIDISSIRASINNANAEIRSSGQLREIKSEESNYVENKPVQNSDAQGGEIVSQSYALTNDSTEETEDTRQAGNEEYTSYYDEDKKKFILTGADGSTKEFDNLKDLFDYVADRSNHVKGYVLLNGTYFKDGSMVFTGQIYTDAEKSKNAWQNLHHDLTDTSYIYGYDGLANISSSSSDAEAVKAVGEELEKTIDSYDERDFYTYDDKGLMHIDAERLAAWYEKIRTLCALLVALQMIMEAKHEAHSLVQEEMLGIVFDKGLDTGSIIGRQVQNRMSRVGVAMSALLLKAFEKNNEVEKKAREEIDKKHSGGANGFFRSVWDFISGDSDKQDQKEEERNLNDQLLQASSENLNAFVIAGHKLGGNLDQHNIPIGLAFYQDKDGFIHLDDEKLGEIRDKFYGMQNIKNALNMTRTSRSSARNFVHEEMTGVGGRENNANAQRLKELEDKFETQLLEANINLFMQNARLQNNKVTLDNQIDNLEQGRWIKILSNVILAIGIVIGVFVPPLGIAIGILAGGLRLEEAYFANKNTKVYNPKAPSYSPPERSTSTGNNELDALNQASNLQDDVLGEVSSDKVSEQESDSEFADFMTWTQSYYGRAGENFKLPDYDQIALIRKNLGKLQNIKNAIIALHKERATARNLVHMEMANIGGREASDVVQSSNDVDFRLSQFKYDTLSFILGEFVTGQNMAIQKDKEMAQAINSFGLSVVLSLIGGWLGSLFSSGAEPVSEGTQVAAVAASEAAVQAAERAAAEAMQEAAQKALDAAAAEEAAKLASEAAKAARLAAEEAAKEAQRAAAIAATKQAEAEAAKEAATKAAKEMADAARKAAQAQAAEGALRSQLDQARSALNALKPDDAVGRAAAQSQIDTLSDQLARAQAETAHLAEEAQQAAAKSAVREAESAAAKRAYAEAVAKQAEAEAAQRAAEQIATAKEAEAAAKQSTATNLRGEANSLKEKSDAAQKAAADAKADLAALKYKGDHSALGKSLGAALAEFLSAQTQISSAYGAKYDSDTIPAYLKILRKNNPNSTEARLTNRELEIYEQLLAQGINNDIGGGYWGLNGNIIARLRSQLSGVYNINNAIASLSAARAEARNLVHAEMTGVGGRRPGQLADEVNRNNLETSMAFFDSLIQFLGERVAVQRRSVDAKKAFNDSIWKLGINIAVSTPCAVLGGPAVQYLAAPIAGLASSVYGLIVAIVRRVDLEAQQTARENRRQQINNDKTMNTLDDMEIQTYSEISDALIEKVGAGKYGVNTAAISVLRRKMEKIYNIKEVIAKIHEAQASARSEVHSVISGGGGRISRASQAFAGERLAALSNLSVMFENIRNIIEVKNKATDANRAIVTSAVRAAASAVVLASLESQMADIVENDSHLRKEIIEKQADLKGKASAAIQAQTQALSNPDKKTMAVFEQQKSLYGEAQKSYSAKIEEFSQQQIDMEKLQIYRAIVGHIESLSIWLSGFMYDNLQSGRETKKSNYENQIKPLSGKGWAASVNRSETDTVRSEISAGDSELNMERYSDERQRSEELVNIGKNAIDELTQNYIRKLKKGMDPRALLQREKKDEKLEAAAIPAQIQAVQPTAVLSPTRRTEAPSNPQAMRARLEQLITQAQAPVEQYESVEKAEKLISTTGGDDAPKDLTELLEYLQGKLAASRDAWGKAVVAYRKALEIKAKAAADVSELQTAIDSLERTLAAIPQEMSGQMSDSESEISKKVELLKQKITQYKERKQVKSAELDSSRKETVALKEALDSTKSETAAIARDVNRIQREIQQKVEKTLGNQMGTAVAAVDNNPNERRRNKHSWSIEEERAEELAKSKDPAVGSLA